ncbi:hypothetical protein AHF37_03707 [Paragonimus kellicotti]|nr:hypothetical protein AHF37_03707 [Paragonimus kellicotti]
MKKPEKQNWCLVNANLSVIQHSNNMRMLVSKMEADYVLIVSGCMASHSLDDVSNIQWMTQTAEEASPKEITARSYLDRNVF